MARKVVPVFKTVGVFATPLWPFAVNVNFSVATRGSHNVFQGPSARMSSF